jgi:twitching motility protein PilT
VIDVFPPHQQQQVRVMLSAALQGVVAQQLLPTSDGRGRIAAVEVLLPTPAVRNLIREGKTHQLYSAIQTGGEQGMQTMDAALVDLVQRNRITIEAARRRASVLAEFERLLADGKPALASSQVAVGATNGYLQ